MKKFSKKKYNNFSMGNLKLADYKTKFACEVEIENFRD
jgi:hypothetical protein